jgi:hypothetical protein
MPTETEKVIILIGWDVSKHRRTVCARSSSRCSTIDFRGLPAAGPNWVGRIGRGALAAAYEPIVIDTLAVLLLPSGSLAERARVSGPLEPVVGA